MRKGVSISEDEIIAETQRFFVKVYGWMSVALIITGLVAVWASSNQTIMRIILDKEYVFVSLLVFEFLLVMFLVGWIKKISSQTATLILILYSGLNGLTLSVIFLVFTTDSIASTFFITAGTFAIMSVYGYFTKTDLTNLGNLLLMALFGLILSTIINIFFQNELLYWITTFAGILIFIGLIAYDTQKIKKLNIIGNEGKDEDKKESIMGALTLYLDFINLFLDLLRLFGKRK